MANNSSDRGPKLSYTKRLYLRYNQRQLKPHILNFHEGMTTDEFLNDSIIESEGVEVLDYWAKEQLLEKYLILKDQFYINNKWKFSKFRIHVNGLSSVRKRSYLHFTMLIFELALEYSVIRGEINKEFYKRLKRYSTQILVNDGKSLESKNLQFKVNTKDRAALINAFRDLKKNKSITIGNKKLAQFIYSNFDTGYSFSSLHDIFRKDLEVRSKK